MGLGSLARVIWVTNWFDINPPASPNVVHSWAKLIKNVPDCDVKTQAILSISKSLKDLPASFREPWRELSKTFSVSESQPQIGSQTNQGSGIQGFREQGAGAARLAATTKTKDRKTFPEPDARMIRIAGEVLRDAPRGQPTDYYVDAVLFEWRQHGIEANQALAIVALTRSQEGRTA